MIIPTMRGGPLRLRIVDIDAERLRVISSLNVEPFEIYSSEEVPMKNGGHFLIRWKTKLDFFNT